MIGNHSATSSAAGEASTHRSRRPGPVASALLRAPAHLYDWDIGWILGRRFLRLTHVGRRTGRKYQTMLEVLGENRDRREVIVIAGLGRSAQWYRNLRAGKATEVAIGRARFTPSFRELEADEAAAALSAYEQRSRYLAPVVRSVLGWLVGWRYDGTPSQRRRLVTELPMVALRPVDASLLDGDHLDELLSIEDAFWRAAGDREGYERNLAADAIHIFPGWGVAERLAVLAAVAEADPWQRFEIDDPRVVSLGDGAAALVYTATAQRAGQPTYHAAITSVYRRRGDTWELVVHQQTPLDAP